MKWAVSKMNRQQCNAKVRKHTCLKKGCCSERSRGYRKGTAKGVGKMVNGVSTCPRNYTGETLKGHNLAREKNIKRRAG